MLYIENFEQDHHPSLQKPTPAQIKLRRKRRRLFVTVLIVAGLALAAGEALATERHHKDDGPRHEREDDGPRDNDGPTDNDKTEAPQRSDPSREGGKTCDDYTSLQKLPPQCETRKPRPVTNQDVGSKR